MDRPVADFLGRLLVPTVMMAVALWYLASLWDARQRELNLILIRPVVLAMIPCYVAIVVHEVLRFVRAAPEAGRPREPLRASAAAALRRFAGASHLHLMIVTVLGVAAFFRFGALPATVLFVLAGLLVLGVRHVAVVVLVPLGTAAVLWLAFVLALGVRIPLY